jgi:hypothetical protein
MNLKEQLPQNARNRISEVLDFKISRGRIPPDPPTSAVNKTTGSAPDLMFIVITPDMPPSRTYTDQLLEQIMG